jgi:hypothetical protein
VNRLPSGIDPAKPGELNEDTLWLGFERIGSELVACCAVRELA